MRTACVQTARHKPHGPATPAPCSRSRPARAAMTPSGGEAAARAGSGSPLPPRNALRIRSILLIVEARPLSAQARERLRVPHGHPSALSGRQPWRGHQGTLFPLGLPAESRTFFSFFCKKPVFAFTEPSEYNLFLMLEPLKHGYLGEFFPHMGVGHNLSSLHL